VCSAGGSQYLPVIASDGSGGAIIAWEDLRSGNFDIHAQRLDASGVPRWAADGVSVCTAAGEQRHPGIVSDGAGGAIVCWHDRRNGAFIYAQHVDSAGAALWTADGMRVAAGSYGQIEPVVASDGAGGAIIAWQDARESDVDLYAQHLDGAGGSRWRADGIPICTAPGWQLNYSIAPDGKGGAVLAWQNRQNEGTTNHVFAQRVSASGAIAWTVDGIALTRTPGGQYFPCVADDGESGALVAWEDSRSGVTDEYGQETYDIYAQRLSAGGTALWDTDGVALCTQPTRQVFPKVVSDGTRGAVVCWEDYRSHNGWVSDVFAQRVDADGAVAWTNDGVGVCTAIGNQYSPAIVPDGAGGTIVCWFDGRTVENGFDIYAQQVSRGGIPQWRVDGEPLCTAPGDQYTPGIAPDGAGGAVLAWYDGRPGAEYDIYAGHVPPTPCSIPDPVVSVGPATFSFDLAGARPNPTRYGTSIEYSLSRETSVHLTIYDATGRRVRDLFRGLASPGPHSARWDERDDGGRAVKSGLYVVRMEAEGHALASRVVVTR
jgi:hypothetical protein